MQFRIRPLALVGLVGGVEEARRTVQNIALAVKSNGSATFVQRLRALLLRVQHWDFPVGEPLVTDEVTNL